MLTELGEKYLNIKTLEARKQELDKEIERKEKTLEMLGTSVEEVMEETTGACDNNIYDQTHIFAVNGGEDRTRLVGINAPSKHEAKDELINNLPAVVRIHSYIGEVNQMVGTNQQL